MSEADSGPGDGEVVQRVLGGDADAFSILLSRHGRAVFSVVARRVPRDEIDEVAHDVFIRAFRSLEGYRDVGRFEHWLARIAVRTCHDFWRERYRRRECPISSLGEEQRAWVERAGSAGSESAGERRALAREADELLEWALARISPEDRAVLELVHIEERPVKEAAGLLGWSRANVKVRAFRARKRLRRIIEELLNEEEGER